MTPRRAVVRPLDRLAALSLTYPEVGATVGALPDGYAHVELDAHLGAGRPAYDAAVEALMTWQMHVRAGLSPLADAARVDVGGHVLQRIGVGRLRVGAPCRVVAVVDEPDRAGFAYGSLPGHPVCGEERFLVVLRADDQVRLQVRAFSRPVAWWTRAAGPATRLAQRTAARLYARALRRACAGA